MSPQFKARRKLYLYIIGGDRDGPVKIGVSTKPENRLCELQVGNPARLKILAKFCGDKRDEAALHRLLELDRLNGEWFRRQPALQAFKERAHRKPEERDEPSTPENELDKWLKAHPEFAPVRTTRPPR